MKNRKLKITLLALLGFLAAESAVQAQATDVTVVNRVPATIHPYFRTKCWAVPPAVDPNGWRFAGGILGNSQFTWDAFEGQLRANCKHPVLRFTFAMDGEAPPTGRGIKERVTKMEIGSVPVFTITLGNVPEIVDVTPDDDGDGDDD